MGKNIPDYQFLKKINLFQSLSQKEMRRIQKHLHEVDFRKGDMIFAEGNRCEKIFIVFSGRLKIFRNSATGREQIIEILGAGETCACNPGARVWECSTSAQALTSGKLFYLSRAEYFRLVESNHKLTKELNQIFAERICRLCSLIEDVSLTNSQQRVAKFILDMAGNEDGKKANSCDSTILFTHDEISQRLGLVRETVTRHLNRLKRDNLIEIQARQIFIKDKSGLEKILL